MNRYRVQGRKELSTGRVHLYAEYFTASSLSDAILQFQALAPNYEPVSASLAA